MTTQLGAAVVGLGFMGRTHVRAYHAARGLGLPVRFLAACETDPAARTGASTAARGNIATGAEQPLFDPAQTRLYSDPRELAADKSVHIVSICTPTDTHIELAAMMLEAGKHVIVEKPVSLDPARIRDLDRLARDSGKLCMPAMCMRFWPGWDWLKDRIADNTLGPVRSAIFTRVGTRPTWGAGFYADESRSGGALFDMHVHDTDIVYWLFGPPDSVTSTGTTSHLSTLYTYARAGSPSPIVAEGGWLAPSGLPYRMRYTVEFQQAVADWDIQRPPAERLVLARNGKAETIPLTGDAGYDPEVHHFVEAVAARERNPRSHKPLRATLTEAAAVTDLLLAERHSLQTGAPTPATARPSGTP